MNNLQLLWHLRKKKTNDVLCLSYNYHTNTYSHTHTTQYTHTDILKQMCEINKKLHVQYVYLFFFFSYKMQVYACLKKKKKFTVVLTPKMYFDQYYVKLSLIFDKLP